MNEKVYNLNEAAAWCNASQNFLTRSKSGPIRFDIRLLIDLISSDIDFFNNNKLFKSKEAENWY